MRLSWRAFTVWRHAIRRAEPPAAEVQLEQHKDELPPRLNIT